LEIREQMVLQEVREILVHWELRAPVVHRGLWANPDNKAREVATGTTVLQE
jgi:hypothetical protein